MTEKEKEKLEKDLKKENQILRFANGLRGQYIISQALYYGIKSLKEVEPPFQEQSNISDMEFLQGIYPMFTPPEDVAKAIAELEKAKEIMEANKSDAAIV